MLLLNERINGQPCSGPHLWQASSQSELQNIEASFLTDHDQQFREWALATERIHPLMRTSCNNLTCHRWIKTVLSCHDCIIVTLLLTVMEEGYAPLHPGLLETVSRGPFAAAAVPKPFSSEWSLER